MSESVAVAGALRPRRPVIAASWAAALAFLIAGAALLPSVGISWDEPTERARGERMLHYWSSLGADRAVLDHLDSAYYGNLFVAAAVVVEHAVPRAPWPLVWHALVLLCGAVGVALAAHLAERLHGARAAWLAALLLGTTPRWFGHALFNPKDVPFAAAYALAIAALVRLADQAPRPRALAWVLFGAASGLACAIRMGGLVLLPLPALVVAASWIRARRMGRPIEWRSAAPRLGAGMALAAGTAALVLLPFWPYLHRAPIRALLDVLSVQGSFPWYSKVLFAGAWVGPRAVAHVYLPTWLWIGLPLGWIVGLVAAPFARSVATPSGVRRLAVALAAGLPVAFVVARGVPLYDGLRQMLFVLPPLAALAAGGWSRLLERGRARWRRVAAAALLALVVAEPVAWIGRAGALAYTYVQPLAGGFAESTWRFDSDYWALGLRDMAAELDRLAASRRPDDPLRVRVVRPGYLSRSMKPFLDDPARVRWLAPDEAAEAELDVVVGRWLRGPVPDSEAILHRSELVRGQKPFAYLRRTPARTGEAADAPTPGPTAGSRP